MAECTRPKKRFQPVSGAAAGFVYLCLGFCFLMQRAISSWRLANAGDSLHRQMPSGGRVFARATREKLCQWIMRTIINGFCLILILYALYSALVDPAGRPLRLTLSMFQNPPISIYSFLSPIVWFIYRLPLFSHSLSLSKEEEWRARKGRNPICTRTTAPALSLSRFFYFLSGGRARAIDCARRLVLTGVITHTTASSSSSSSFQILTNYTQKSWKSNQNSSRVSL